MIDLASFIQICKFDNRHVWEVKYSKTFEQDFFKIFLPLEHILFAFSQDCNWN